jgi:glycosyltransferase involved in cell wall biosynthesis
MLVRKMDSTIPITVLVPVYNGEPYVGEAIGSILAQTLYEYELLIIDDGSTDRTTEIVRSFRDKRIRLVRNGENRGLIATLNHGVEIARGKYIARMDSDDISHPERLEKQFQFMKQHQDIQNMR